MSYILEIKNLSKKYLNNDHYSLKDANLNIERGKIIGLIGHNGAGKSTLIKCLVGINSFKEGEALINGVSIKTNPLEAKNNFAYCGDRENIEGSLTAQEYFKFVSSIYNLNKTDAANTLSELVEIFNFTPYLNKKIQTFSLGTKQKLSLIKTFLINRDLIILDEPLNGLDPTINFVLKNYIKKLKTMGKTILFSSHYIKVVENICDEIVIIKEGQILEHTALAEILKANSLVDYYFQKTGFKV